MAAFVQPVADRPIVHGLVQQHAEETALLRHVRSRTSTVWRSPASMALQAAAQAGQRLFCGEPADMPDAARVLRDGTQRLRARAALWLRVLQPEGKLFQVAAPTTRQRRWLGPNTRAL